MKQWFKKVTGIEAEEQRLAQEREAAEAERKRIEEAEMELLKKRDPKEYATRKGEPWVSVLDVKVNQENVRNGFFEMDWNSLFIKQLIEAGYGVDNDPEEEIVDRWFRELCANVVVDGDYGGAVNTGVIDIASVRKNNK